MCPPGTDEFPVIDLVTLVDFLQNLEAQVNNLEAQIDAQDARIDDLEAQVGA